MWVCLLLPAVAAEAQDGDRLAHRYVSRTTSYGAGWANVYDTYLSPQEYRGPEFRVMRETMRLVRWADGRVSVQNLFQAHLSYTENRAQTSGNLTAMACWNYGMHRQWRVGEHWKLLAGGATELNGGLIYNLRNSNNPVSAKAYVGLVASGMAIVHFRVRHHPMTARYQVGIPLAGLQFSPDHQQSYYEIFTQGNAGQVVRFASVHNRPSLRQMVSLDVPVGLAQMRFSYVCDWQQSRVNGLRTHIYSHVFMLGFVKSLYRLRDKRLQPLPAY